MEDWALMIIYTMLAAATFVALYQKMNGNSNAPKKAASNQAQKVTTVDKQFDYEIPDCCRMEPCDMKDTVSESESVLRYYALALQEYHALMQCGKKKRL